MKKTLKNGLLLAIVCLIVCSCNNSRFNDAVTILGSLPVFFNEEKVQQTVDFENGKLVISFPYEQLDAKWADAVGDDWVPRLFLRKLFDNNLAAYTLGATLKTKSGDNPIDHFLSLMDEQKASFIIKYGGKSAEFSTDDVRKILNENSNKDDAAPFVTTSLDNFAKDFNDALQNSGFYVASAKEEQGTFYININCSKNANISRTNQMATEAITSYSAIPLHCYLNNLGLAFRYHKVDNSDQLTTNQTFDSNFDTVLPVPSSKLEEVWKRVEQMRETQVSQNSDAAVSDSVAAVPDSVA